MNDEKCLTAAIEASEIVWARGILKKGVGICHGVAGNAYLFLYLHRVTNDPMYLLRAQTFIKAAVEWEEAYELERKRALTAGEEFGLFEGWGGVARVLMDLIWSEGQRGLVGVFAGAEGQLRVMAFGGILGDGVGGYGNKCINCRRCVFSCVST